MDMIRVYRKLYLAQSPAAPGQLAYIGEERVEGRADGYVGAVFDCDVFDGDYESDAYCFRYVSVWSHGGVYEQEEICLPSYQLPGLTCS